MFALLLILTCCQLWSWHAESAAIKEPVPILHSVAKQLNSGSYFFMYEGADGTYREELGIVNSDSKSTDEDDDDGDLEVSGIYRYIDDGGQALEVSYTADKNGFLPHVKYISKGKTINKAP
ncbi:larval cuticle protein 1 [Drosophila eugracilis]|uniref:larval cuticle protein 1 n=1 Tax=Drosophila eugracilis TaxID=29029 RepID=UPI0007E7AF7A|nr:larval cuticle protein 1 [Drosophila eugracilis]